jgi:excisionase family DNA binding protein
MTHNTEPNAGKELLVSVPQACERLSISRMTLYRLLRRDQIKTVKIGRRRLVSATELNRFVARMERASD